jgi:glycosyltransferase involved in cell wall biosynthesis
MPSPSIEVTVLMPCLNEAETIEACVKKAVRCLDELGVAGEVLVSDNGSTDGSRELAEANGARVVDAPMRGYGSALLAGIEAARGRYVIMADADDSYDLSNLGPFIERLRAGNDVVMGNRFKGGIAPGAMPPLHRYLGNPVLSRIGRILFGLRGVGDFHCGIRGFNRDRIRALGLCMPGMEFASELVVRAALAGYSVVEVPTTLQPDGRSRRPHLRTWRDGWRHLRFLLVFAPRKILVWPGAVIATIGLIGTVALTIRPIPIGSTNLDVNSLIYACLALIVGVQLILFGGFAEIYGRHEGITGSHHVARWTKLLRLETCMAVGLALMLGGAIGTLIAFSQWGAEGFGAIGQTRTIRWVLGSTTAISLGVIIMCAGLFTSLLTLRSARPGPAVPDEELTELGLTHTP